MEFATLEEAIAHANRKAELLHETHYVLCGSGARPYWVTGPFGKDQLWPDRPAQYVAAAK